jgi:hypothetical protein
MVLPRGWSRWKKPGDHATEPKAIKGGNKDSNQPSSRYLEDGSFIRLRNVTLSYNLPVGVLNNINISSAKVFIRGENLWTQTDFSGMDPEVSLGLSGGTSTYKYPISKRILIGININI